MKLKQKLMLLEAFMIIIFGVMMFVQSSWEQEEETTVVYHLHNLTYLEQLNDEQINMHDPLLINAIRSKFLIAPSPHRTAYNLVDPYLGGFAVEMAENLAYMMQFKRNGFFVEARAFDGETRSNTLLFEYRLSWTGLLVEHDPIKVSQILEKNRKAWVSPSCISIYTHPHMRTFYQHLKSEKNRTLRSGQKKIGMTDVQCLPLYSIMLALNRTEIDYLCLDVKGQELEVLRTIPFNILNIKALTLDCSHEQLGKGLMLRYMQGQGYDLYASMVHPDEQSVVFIFFRQDKDPKFQHFEHLNISLF